MKPTLFIMAKAPIMGKAKTRLAADIGVVHAKRIYIRMMSHIIRNVQDPRWNTVLAVTPPRALGQVPAWDGLPQIPQVSGSLSPRLAQVFSGQGISGRGLTAVIGTDCPQVTASDIASAFEALKSSPAVFGPASDGGFWLMGARAPLPSTIFDDIRWSHENTLDDMRAKFGGVTELRTLTDVDDLAALKLSKLT